MYVSFNIFTRVYLKYHISNFFTLEVVSTQRILLIGPIRLCLRYRRTPADSSTNLIWCAYSESATIRIKGDFLYFNSFGVDQFYSINRIRR